MDFEWRKKTQISRETTNADYLVCSNCKISELDSLKDAWN